MNLKNINADIEGEITYTQNSISLLTFEQMAWT
jgi:hypothetical protein